MNPNKLPSIKWLFVTIALICFFIVLQLPAAWLYARVLTKSPVLAQYITAVSGNIWQGEANWQMPTQRGTLQGTLAWHSKPWQLLLLRVAADIEVQTGSSKINTGVVLGKNKYYIEHANGDIAADTLRVLTPITWPDSPIHITDTTLKYQTGSGFLAAEGTLNYSAGTLGYPFEGHIERANLPPLVGLISMEKDQFHLALTNSNKEKMGDIYLSKDNLMDVRLTQRLLLNVAGYKGQAGLDTAVVSLRQPLSSLGAM